MSKMIVNNKIGTKEVLSVTDMEPGHTYRVTFNDGNVKDVLVCHADSWHIDIENNEKLIVCFENSVACIIDSDLVNHIEHINVEVNIAK